MQADSTASGDTPQSAKCHACGTVSPVSRGNCPHCNTPFSKRHPPGTILGSYRLHEVIGEGGMGIVYLATHEKLGRRVAIKMLRTHFTHNPQAVHRFFAEARAVNKINHPNIVEITDFIEQPGGDNYYVMELLQGTSLATLMSATILPLSRTVSIMMQVASALEAVHEAGIVHRDVKPDNVFLAERAGQKDVVKLVDFGVAKLTGDTAGPISSHSTNPGAVLGTPDYMSPEQASGTAVDHRTDIYAFGAMLYQMVTGHLPIVGANFGEIVVQLLTEPPKPPRDYPDLPHEVPESLQELILACLAKATIDRPDRMATVSERLSEIADEQGWIVYELNLNTSGSHTLPRESKAPSGQIPPMPPRERASGQVPRLPTPAPIPSPLDVLEARPRARTQPPVPEPAFPGVKTPPSSGDVVHWPDAGPRRPRWLPFAIGGAVLAVVAVVALVLMGGDKPPAGGERNDAATAVQRELTLADERIAAGRLVSPDGDDALAHLLAARRLDPTHTGVRDRLRELARTYEQLAEQALRSDSLSEAAAHLQVVLTAEPDNAAAAKQIKLIEAQILERQRGTKQP